ncbi:hypothetical protein CPT03_10665 [Pedobacter ginsengisoli]|uniref:Uncharacterized protein n=1 Tax=Pedobacter ginsengisoli TaxID=363852 RepID=A0A2D1U5N4_9SPHI|nr:hypothetical protein [Pedobacter ginsengisoli]ATP56907.1 hypothetical protein CPT03_10665 [Pedobacter ginsengisoli]
MEEVNFDLIFRFGCEKWLNKLRNKGSIRLNTVKFFQDLKINKQGDRNEGISSIQTILFDTLNLKNGDLAIELENVSGKLKKRDIKGNLYCVYGARQEDLWSFYEKKIEKLVSESAIEFSTHFLCIHNAKQFNQRIQNELIRRGYEFDFNIVRYNDYTKDHRKLDIFDKSDEFSDQKELRYWLKTEGTSHIDVEIGCIKDISYKVFTLDELKTIQLGYTESDFKKML